MVPYLLSGHPGGFGKRTESRPWRSHLVRWICNSWHWLNYVTVLQEKRVQVSPPLTRGPSAFIPENEVSLQLAGLGDGFENNDTEGPFYDPACSTVPGWAPLKAKAMASLEQVPVGKNHPSLSHKLYCLISFLSPAFPETAMSDSSALPGWVWAHYSQCQTWGEACPVLDYVALRAVPDLQFERTCKYDFTP